MGGNTHFQAPIPPIDPQIRAFGAIYGLLVKNRSDGKHVALKIGAPCCTAGLRMPYKPKVLIVEDEKLIRWALAQELTNQGYTVLETGDGVEALELVAAHLPSLVLLDVTLPRLNGMEVLKKIRSNHPDCIVVVITAHGTAEMEREAASLGAAKFLKKPFKNDSITQLLNELLKYSRH